jgi:hypothetical protein
VLLRASFSLHNAVTQVGWAKLELKFKVGWAKLELKFKVGWAKLELKFKVPSMHQRSFDHHQPMKPCPKLSSRILTLKLLLGPLMHSPPRIPLIATPPCLQVVDPRTQIIAASNPKSRIRARCSVFRDRTLRSRMYFSKSLVIQSHHTPLRCPLASLHHPKLCRNTAGLHSLERRCYPFARRTAAERCGAKAPQVRHSGTWSIAPCGVGY